MTQSTLPSPNAEQRRAAAGQYDRANQVIANGDHDYGIQLLKNCCKLDPGNMIYRGALRGTAKVKFQNNLRGSRFAAVTMAPLKLRLRRAHLSGDHLKVLEIAEDILGHNPWDIGTQLTMAEAFDALEATGIAVWTLEQARQKDTGDLKLNRHLARLYEKAGQFTHAGILWALIRRAYPKDEEAQRKAKDLAANETIARGHYDSVIQFNQGESLEGDDDDSGEESTERERQSPLIAHRSNRDMEALKSRIEDHPHDPQNYLQLAELYRRIERWDNVRATLEQGLKAAGYNFELAISLADVQIQPFRADLAAADAKLEIDPDNEKLQRQRDNLHKEICTRELDIFRQKSDRFPTDMGHRLEMGTRLLQIGQIDEAIAQLQMARTDPRSQWQALIYLGFCFKERKNWRLAQRNFEDALRYLPPGEMTRRREILFQLAKGCAEDGDLSAAIEWGYELANEDFAYKNIGSLLDDWQGRLRGA